jgi:23S rRNA (uridine2552-2'-O)-methyltransferase
MDKDISKNEQMKITNKKIARSKSSSAWMQRQARDPFVARAKKDGYRSRAVYKLIEINEKFKFLHDGQTVVDLGAAPGSWSQYVAATYPKSRVIAMDLLDIKPISNVDFYVGDFTTDDAWAWLNAMVLTHSKKNSGRVDAVLSDIAPNTTGHQKTDHLRQMVLLEYAFDFAKSVLKPGGTFVAKSFTGGATGDILREMRKVFAAVHPIKPEASRKDSVEMFLVGLGFKG